MKKLLLLSVVVLIGCVKEVQTPKSRLVKADMQLPNSFYAQYWNIEDTLIIEVDAIGTFAKEGVTTVPVIIPSGQFNYCMHAQYGFVTWAQSETKDVPYRIKGRSGILRSGLLKFSEHGHLTVII